MRQGLLAAFVDWFTRLAMNLGHGLWRLDSPLT
jgi:hypothetical protein